MRKLLSVCLALSFSKLKKNMIKKGGTIMKKNKFVISIVLCSFLLFSSVLATFASPTNLYDTICKQVNSALDSIQKYFLVPTYATGTIYNNERAVKYEIYCQDSNVGFYYLGGSLSWRNNNPGNIEYGKFGKANGAIGKNKVILDDGSIQYFSIFPTFETGFNAMEKLILSNYKNSTIKDMLNKYAPKKHNKTNEYIKYVTNQTGLKDSYIIKNLSSSQKKSLLSAMMRYEGFRVGTAVPIEK